MRDERYEPFFMFCLQHHPNNTNIIACLNVYALAVNIKYAHGSANLPFRSTAIRTIMQMLIGNCGSSDEHACYHNAHLSYFYASWLESRRKIESSYRITTLFFSALFFWCKKITRSIFVGVREFVEQKHTLFSWKCATKQCRSQ